MIQALIFDFDGTLVDSDPIKRSVFYDVTRDAPGAAEILDAIFAAANPGDRHDIFANLATQLESNSASDWTTAYGRHCQNRILGLLASSNIGQTLARLKADGYGLFIASATPQDDLISIVKKSPLATFFSGVYGRPNAKTDIMRNILQGHGWTPREIVMIGNSEPDLQAAHEVGCPFIAAVGFGGNLLSSTGMKFNHMDELPGIIDRLNSTMPEQAYS